LKINKLTAPASNILKIIATPQPDRLLIYNAQQLYQCKYENGQIEIEKAMPLSFPAESIIYNPGSNLIYCSNQENFTRADLNTFTVDNTQKPFTGSFIDYTWGKDKTLWLATRSGLQHYDSQNRLIGSINTTNGLNNDVVYAVRPNHDSTLLYLSTNLGISCFTIASGKIQNFSLADGLLETEHDGAASAVDENGNYYFGNIKGISVFNESFNHQTTVKPFLIVQGIYVDDTSFNSRLNPNFIRQIDLYPHNKAFGINFSLLSTSEPGRLVYSYKIEGIDNNFHRSNTATAIRIPKPGPGIYTIVLKGEVEGGAIIEKRIKLFVHAPFYLKWWFLLPAILLFHFGIFLIVRQIIRTRLRKKQQEIDSQRLLYEQKSQIARELHDNVGARLSMMLNTVDWIGKKPQIEARDLSEIKENTKAVIQGLRDAIWVMDKTQITVEELFDKIKYYTHQISRNYPVSISFNEVTHQTVILNTTQALNLFRILQESLNNALKYSEASQIEISLNYEGENGIIFSFSDNGKGFDSAGVVTGHGLKNMQIRANEIKAQLNLQSIINEGTNIIVKLYIV
jgi:two-component sensor histidine kinase